MTPLSAGAFAPSEASAHAAGRMWLTAYVWRVDDWHVNVAFLLILGVLLVAALVGAYFTRDRRRDGNGPRWTF